MHRHTPHSSDGEIDYSSRRMSSSAASDSSLHSRPEKRAYDISPSASPIPKRSRPELSTDPHDWNSSAAHDQDDSRSELSNHSPRVQLPSIASTFHDHHDLRRNSLPSTLLSTGSDRLRLPTPTLHRPSQSQSGLSSYQFPAPASASENSNGSAEDSHRSRLYTETQVGLHDYSGPSTAISSSSSFSFSGNSPLSGAPPAAQDDSGTTANWAPASIVRPSSTPNQVPGALSPSLKYDGSSSPSPLYGGVTRIAGHHPTDRTQRIKTEGDQWAFPSTADSYTSMGSSATTPSGLAASGAPSIAVTTSPGQRSPSASSLVERPPRKRGKLPKPVTDYLKDWLHRHSDHPYPSEDEKKALCNATGLSMSQVSNWMINVSVFLLRDASRVLSLT